MVHTNSGIQKKFPSNIWKHSETTYPRKIPEHNKEAMFLSTQDCHPSRQTSI